MYNLGGLFMNIFQKIKLVTSISKAIDAIKEESEKNGELVSEVQDLIADIVKLIEKIKKLVPQVADTIETIVNILKNIFKK